jgi:hypothetical protein
LSPEGLKELAVLSFECELYLVNVGVPKEYGTFLLRFTVLVVFRLLSVGSYAKPYTGENTSTETLSMCIDDGLERKGNIAYKYGSVIFLSITNMVLLAENFPEMRYLNRTSTSECSSA